MLKVIQLIFRGYIVYTMVIIKVCIIVSMVIILRVICPQNRDLIHFHNFRVGLHALELLDTALPLGYTMIAHIV